MKSCNKCGEVKQLDLFMKGKKYKDGRKNTCKSCHSKYMTEYYLKNKDKYEEKLRLNRGDKRYKPSWKRHGLDEATFNQMSDKFNGLCWACKEREHSCIDHDHSCCKGNFGCVKCVRGLLCFQCNVSLGLLGEDATKVQGLLQYVQALC